MEVLVDEAVLTSAHEEEEEELHQVEQNHQRECHLFPDMYDHGTQKAPPPGQDVNGFSKVRNGQKQRARLGGRDSGMCKRVVDTAVTSAPSEAPEPQQGQPRLDDHDADLFSKVYYCPDCDYSTIYGYHLKTHIRRRHMEVKPYQCGDCDYSCGSKSDLTRHQRYRHIKKKPYKCKECDYSCVAQSNLKTHQRFKHSNSLSENDVLGVTENSNTTQMTLEGHSVATNPVIRTYTCSECGTFSTASLSSLKFHMGETHKRQIAFKCRECDYSTTKKGFLHMHYRNKHPNIKPLLCNKCSFATCWPLALKNHYINKHHEELLLDLEVKDDGVDGSFRIMDPDEHGSRHHKLRTIVHVVGAREALELGCGDPMDQHEDLTEPATELPHVSENEKLVDTVSCKVEIVGPGSCVGSEELSSPGNRKNGSKYPCSECEYSSPLYHNLLKHTRRCHLKEKPFKCGDCAYAASAKDDLLRHRRYRHSNERPYKCTECDYASVVLYNLQIHYRFKHKHAFQYKCSECEFSDVLKNRVKTHYRRVHKQCPDVEESDDACKCRECDFVTTSKHLLRAHFRRKHSGRKTYRCRICSGGFENRLNLNAHLRKDHSDVRPYLCGECDYSSAWKGALTRHCLKEHAKVKPYQCTDCEFDAAEIRDMERHYRVQHGGARRCGVEM